MITTYKYIYTVLIIAIIMFMIMPVIVTLHTCYALDQPPVDEEIHVSTWKELVEMFAISDTEMFIPADTTVYIDGTLICSNSQITDYKISGGGTIARGQVTGRMLGIERKVSMIIENITFDGSSQVKDQVDGCIITVSDYASVHFIDTTIKNNDGTQPAVKISTQGTIQFDDCIIENNKVHKDPADKDDNLILSSGVYIEKATEAVINNSSFIGNDGAHAVYGAFHIKDCVFEGNVQGGAIAKTLYIENCEIRNNTGYFGVAINEANNINNCIIENNETLDVTDDMLGIYYTSMQAVRDSLDNGNLVNNDFVRAAINQAGVVYLSGNTIIQDTIIQNNTSNTNFGGIRIYPYQKNKLTIQGSKTIISDDIYGGPVPDINQDTFQHEELKVLLLENPFGNYIKANLNAPYNQYDSIVEITGGATLKNMIDAAKIRIHGLVYLKSLTYEPFDISAPLDPQSEIEIMGSELHHQYDDTFTRFQLLDHLYEKNTKFTVARGVDGYELTETDIKCFSLQGNTWQNQRSPDILGIYFGTELNNDPKEANNYSNRIMLFNGSVDQSIDPPVSHPSCPICGAALCMACELCPNCTQPDHLEDVIISVNSGIHEPIYPPTTNENEGSGELVDDIGTPSDITDEKTLPAIMRTIANIGLLGLIPVAFLGGCIALPCMVYKKVRIFRDNRSMEYGDPQWLKLKSIQVHKSKENHGLDKAKAFELKVPQSVVHPKAADMFMLQFNKYFIKRNHGSELLVTIETNNANHGSPRTYSFVIDKENPNISFSYNPSADQV